MPWVELCAVIAPHYPKDPEPGDGGRGNPPAFSEQQKWSYAAIASLMAGVMPPSAMFGRSWL